MGLEFQKKKMHVDGLQEISWVDGCRVVLEPDPSLNGESRILSHRHRDLSLRRRPLVTEAP